MATVDLTSSERIHQFLDGQMCVSENQINFSGTARCAGDVLQTHTAPAGCLGMAVQSRVNTAEGGTATADAGDATDPNGWDDGVNWNATAGTMTKTAQGTDAYAEGHLYTADDTIDWTLDNDMDTAVIDSFFTFVMIEAYVD